MVRASVEAPFCPGSHRFLVNTQGTTVPAICPVCERECMADGTGTLILHRLPE